MGITRRTTLTGAAATEATFRNQAAGATLLHVAAPFKINSASPLFSPVLAGGEAAGLFSLVGAEELLELGWRTRALASELSATPP